MKKLLLYIVLFISINTFAQEGTKQFMPNSTDRLWLEMYYFENFGTYRAADKERIYIYLNAGEKMYFGMNIGEGDYWFSNVNGISFRLKNPSGTIVYPETRFRTTGDAGYIDTHTKAITGPNGAILNGTTISTGYDPLVYTAATSGNYYIEFETWLDAAFTTQFDRRIAIEFFDVTVTDASDNVITNPGNPNLSAGRLWSKGWGLTTGSYEEYPVKAQFYVFTEDEFVNKVNFEMKPFSFSFVANSFGINSNSSLNFVEKAQSQDGIISSDISEYRIFLNDPDRVVWPNTTLPPPIVKVWADETLIYDYDYDRDPQLLSLALDTILLEKNSLSCPYSDITVFKIETNIDGFTNILLDIDGGGYTTDGNDRALNLDLKRGINYVLWDFRNDFNFKNDNDVVIDDGNMNSSATFLGRGPAHFPVYDVESLSGISTSSIRPFNKLGPTLYWDDTQITDWGDVGGSMIETQQSQLEIDNHVPRVWVFDDAKEFDQHNGNLATFNSWFNAIDLGLPNVVYKVQTGSNCVNGDAPYVGDIYIESAVNAVHTFSVLELEEKYFDPKNDDLDSIAILTLPSNGVLELSTVPVNVNDSISRTDIANLTFTPNNNWSGMDEFVWKATNGTYWSLNQDTVYLIINTDPTITSINDTTICTNINLEDVSFTVGDAESAAADLNVVAYSHDPLVIPNTNITIGGSGANRTITVSPPANTSGYTIIYVKVDDGLTEVIESFEIYIGPSISFQGDTTICAGNPLELTAIEFGADSYSWQFGGTEIRTTQDLTIDPFTADSVGAYTLTVSKDLCTASKVINVSISPQVSFTGETTVCSGNPISLSANETVATSYTWTNGVLSQSTKVLSYADVSAANVASNNWTLEVVKEGCTNISEAFTIVANPAPAVKNYNRKHRRSWR
jgi:hypothetical protein